MPQNGIKPDPNTPRQRTGWEKIAMGIIVIGTEETPRWWGQTPEPGNPSAELTPREVDHREWKRTSLDAIVFKPTTVVEGDSKDNTYNRWSGRR